MSQRTIRITAGGVTASAVLDGSRTADAIWKALPLAAKASTWGDEIYFDIGVRIDAEAPKETVTSATSATGHLAARSASSSGPRR